jgi:hypothetical protein
MTVANRKSGILFIIHLTYLDIDYMKKSAINKNCRYHFIFWLQNTLKSQISYGSGSIWPTIHTTKFHRVGLPLPRPKTAKICFHNASWRRENLGFVKFSSDLTLSAKCQFKMYTVKSSFDQFLFAPNGSVDKSFGGMAFAQMNYGEIIFNLKSIIDESLWWPKSISKSLKKLQVPHLELFFVWEVS